ncbi:MAG: YneF family protein [Bacilli bacterium]|nr:YneF family protein [Bacilli bacterium]
MDTGYWIGLLVLALVIGLVAGFFISRYVFKRQLEKNPPINEAMIRALYQSVGRKPSEADIQRTMMAVRRQQR